jgi:hypothetical protein
VSTPRFRFIYGDHESTTIQGVVQGNGGFVKELPRLLLAWRMAKEGRDTGLYEPAPGCLTVYPAYNAHGNGEPEHVDLRQVVRIEPHGFTRT